MLVIYRFLNCDRTCALWGARSNNRSMLSFLFVARLQKYGVSPIMTPFPFRPLRLLASNSGERRKIASRLFLLLSACGFSLSTAPESAAAQMHRSNVRDTFRATPPPPIALDRSLATTNPKPSSSSIGWNASEIADAKRLCTEALNNIHAVIESLPPRRNGRCGTPAPIRLISIGKIAPVKLVPAPTINCRMLVPLKRWIERSLQPAADKYLDTSVTRIQIMSSYACRTRYGRRGSRMSEHAFANALDIGGFVLADKRSVSVLKHWGDTQRDIEAAQTANLEHTRKAVPLATLPTAPTERRQLGSASPPLPVQPRRQSSVSPDLTSSEPTELPIVVLPKPRSAIQMPILPLKGVELFPPLPERRPLRRALETKARPLDPGYNGEARKGRHKRRRPSRSLQLKSPTRLGGPKPKRARPKALFLRSIHASGCRIFGTTLGPEANEAHRNHFHIDMYPRRNRGYCE